MDVDPFLIAGRSSWSPQRDLPRSKCFDRWIRHRRSRGRRRCGQEDALEEIDLLIEPQRDTIWSPTQQRHLHVNYQTIQLAHTLLRSSGKVDLKYLACQHHHVMVETLRSSVKAPSFVKKVAVLGLGGGALCTYLHHAFPSFTIDGVEIDPVMVQLAKKYFGFNPSSNLRAHVADAYHFIHELANDSDRNSIF